MKPNWPTKKLDEVCERLSAKKSPVDSWPYIEISDVNIENKTLIFKEKKSVEGAVVAPENSVIVSRVRPTRGAITLLDQGRIISSAFTILKAKDSEAQPKFLFYSIAWSKEFLSYLQKKQKGSNYPSVREKDIFDFEILLPPLSVQQKMVERLDAIRKAQELNDKQIVLAEELFQSLLEQELEPKGKGWEVKRLDSLIKLSSGKFISSKERKEDGIYPIYGGNGILGYTDRFMLDYSTVAIGRVGFYCGAVHFVSAKSWITDNAIYVKEISRNLNIEVLYYVLLKSNLNRFANPSGQPKITQSPILNLKFFLPPLETQHQIVAKLQVAQAYKKKLLEQKQKLQELFDSCLDKAMKGGLVK